MRDGGKGDTPRPLSVPLEKFDENFDAIFGKKLSQAEKLQKELARLIEEAPISTRFNKNLEPIPFAGMVDTGEDEDEKDE